MYTAMPGLGDADLADEAALLDRMFRDFLDADLVFRLPAEYPEGDRVLRGREGRFRGEKLASAKSFASRHEALDAAGLRE
jgi:hypothetical protein